jgi:hypothetical protein
VTRKALEWFDAARVLEAEAAEPTFAKRRAMRDAGEHWQAIKRTPAMLTAPQLMRRGWRAFDIRRHLDHADGKVSGHDAYRLERVERAETADAVLRAAVKRNAPFGIC